MNSETPDQLDHYRKLALAWDAAKAKPKEANRIFDQHHKVYKQLRETEEGRTGIASLLSDSANVVRLLAATHSLAWARERAEQVLEELSAGNAQYSLDAKWTLRSFRDGKLNLDW